MYLTIKFIKKTALVINLVFAFSLLLAYIAKFIDPRHAEVLAIFGLAYPYFLIINLLFLLFWLVYSKKTAIVSLGIIILALIDMPRLIYFSNKKDCNQSGSSLKVMSWNVRLFDLYNWSHNTETRNRMFDLIKNEKADVLCLQEFFNSDIKNYFTTLDTLLVLQDVRYYHVAYSKTVKKKYHYGLAIFSKYPIIRKGHVRQDGKPLSSSNDCIYADIKTAEDTIRVYNMHLASIRFDNKTYSFIENIGRMKESERIHGFRFIISHLIQAFVQRAAQLDLVLRHINSSPFPIIACADLNDSPTSNAYQRLSKNLTDAFTICGSGMGTTYHGSFPGFRIDYIMTSNELRSSCFQTIPDELSDHHPISCKVLLKN